MAPHNPDPSRTPSSGESVLLFLVSLSLCLTVGLSLQRADLLGGIVGTEVFCILGPLAGAFVAGRFSIGKTLRLRWPGWVAMGLAGLMAPAAAVLAGQVFWLQSLLIPVPAWYVEMMESLAASARGANAWLGILALAVLPAVSEEGLFRGFMLSGLEGRLGRAGALCVGAVFFGLMHLDLYRFSAVCLLGGFLGFLTFASGSLYPAVVVHGVNNLLVVVPVSWAERAGVQWLEGNEGAPTLWAIASTGFLLICGVLFKRVAGNGGAGRGLDAWNAGSENA